MTRKILLADDSITIQKVVELTFSEGDFDVISVGNGELALRKAKEVRPDIALLDVIMPEKNGYEVCQLLKQDPDFRSMPVLLLTGTFESFDHQRAEQSGADGYLTKPFESQMLISKVEELLSTAPRQLAKDETAGRMEIVADGNIRTVGGKTPPAPPAEPPAPAASVSPAATETSPPFELPSLPAPPSPPAEAGAASPSASDAWMSKPDDLGLGFAFAPPPSPLIPAPPSPPPAGLGDAYLEEAGSGPPSTAASPGPPPPAAPADPAPTFAREIPELAAPAGPTLRPQEPRGDAPWAAPDSASSPDGYEQTFELQQGTETVSLAATPPPPDFKAGTLYSDPPPAGASSAEASSAVSPELVDQIARRVVEKLSEQVLREVAWEVIPDLAELLIKQRISELERGGK